jgi:ankyrin repeat protein
MSKVGVTTTNSPPIVSKPRQLDHQLSYAQHQSDKSLKRAVVDDVLNVVNYLIPQKIDIDSADEDTGLTALVRACEANSTTEVKALLAMGASVNAADSSGRSPLMVASAEGNIEILTTLLDHRGVAVVPTKKPQQNNNDLGSGSDSDSDSDSNNDAVSEKDGLNEERQEEKRVMSRSEEVIVAKDIEVDKSPPRRMSLFSQQGLANLLKGGGDSETGGDQRAMDLSAADKYGWTALMYAALCGHESVARVLVDRGADVHAVNIKERTALFVAIRYGKLSVAALLLKCGANINASDVHEWTPAMAAAKRGEIEAVTFSIDNGAVLSINNQSLLTIAAIYGHLELVKCLLERKVKPSLGLRDKENEAVLICAAEHKHILIVQFMLEYGVDVNAVNAMNQNALVMACSKGHEEIANFLLLKQTILSQEDDSGYTAFLYAAANNLVQVVKLLISRGVKVDSASSKSGLRALMCAAKAGHFKLTGLFLDHYGASIDATDYTKKTALHYSCIGGRAEIADLLIVKGARYRKDIFSRTPLYYARNNGHFEVAAALEHRYGDKKILMRADLQPVTNIFDMMFLTVTALACYFDIVFDVINAYTFYQNQQFKYFTLALCFQVIPLFAAVTLQKGWGTKVMAIFHLSIIREFYHSIRGRVETPMMCTLRIIETCLEACPSALLQLYVLVTAWIVNESEGHAARGFYGFLPTSQEQLLFLSILISIGSTSITFIKFVSSEKDRSLMPVKSIINCFVDIQPEKLSNVEGVYCYHCCEEVFRLLTLAVLFISLRGWALAALAVSYLLRMLLATQIHKTENFAECTRKRQFVKILLRIALSQITDCLWYNHFKLTFHLQVLTTLEGLACSLCLLYIQETNTFSLSRVKMLLIVGAMAWVLKTSLYFLTYYWMCTEPIAVLIVDDLELGLYYSSSRQLELQEGGGADEAVSSEDPRPAVEAYELHALADRKNYFRSIMKGVKKAKANKFQYNYAVFPPFPTNEILLLKSVCCQCFELFAISIYVSIYLFTVH